ncbi:MAG: hypothetical protein ACRD51_02535, partial [Candidatus Acidiferrum sp.]
FTFQTLRTRQFALEETVNKSGGKEQLAQWEALFAKNNVDELVIGIIVVQRHAELRPAFTLRRSMRETPPAEIERAMRWETEIQMAGAMGRLQQAKPEAAPGIGITIRHVLKDSEIAPENFTLSVEHPFVMDCKVQPWMVLLLPRCDGKTTVADLFEIAKQNDWIVPQTPAEEFSRLLATLISGGFLQMEAARLPAAAG